MLYIYVAIHGNIYQICCQLSLIVIALEWLHGEEVYPPVRLLQRRYPVQLIASMSGQQGVSCRQAQASICVLSSKAASNNEQCVLIVPYAQMVPELQLHKLLRTSVCAWR
jgi:hypothetical protein